MLRKTSFQRKTKYMEDYVKEVMEEPKPKLEKFLKEKGIFFYPSAANFLLLKVSNHQKIIEYFKSQNILLRPKPAPDGKEAIRVGIGTLRDTERFIKVYTSLLEI
jgi:histidinol-phosphate aminotransferase